MTNMANQHFVQFYGAETAALAKNVARFISGGLLAGASAMIIAVPSHRDEFYREAENQGIDVGDMLDEHRIEFFDADEMLARIVVHERIDEGRFQTIVGAPIEAAAKRGPVRAYGEMVGRLWERGACDAAVVLEACWNHLLASVPRIALMCAYPIDIFAREFNTNAVDGILCAHGALLSSADDARLTAAIETAMSSELYERAGELRPLMKANHRPAWGMVPAGESLLLWLRGNLPGAAERVIAAARAIYSTPGAAR